MARFRSYDIPTALGILIILVWTPVMIAAGSGETVTPGTAFFPPDVRYGDRVEYEVLVQQRGHAAMSTGPVVVHEFRAPSEAEEALGVVLVEERAYLPTNVDFGFARLVQDARRELRWLDSEAQILRMESVSYTATLDGHAERRIEQWGAPYRDAPSGGPYGRELPLNYDPGTTWRELQRLVWTESSVTAEGQRLMAEGIRFPTDEEIAHAPFAARHRDLVLYANMVVRDWFGRVDLSESDRVWVWENASLSAGWYVDDLVVEWEEPLVIEGPQETWEWWSHMLPVQAGRHKAFLDKRGEPTHSVDLVPYAYRPGHERVPITPAAIEYAYTPTVHPALDFDDERPFVRDVSLARMAAWLEDAAAPEDVQAFRRADATFGGVAWMDDGERIEFLISLVQQNRFRVFHIELEQGPVIHNACDGERTWAGRILDRYCDDVMVIPGEEAAGSGAEVVARLRAELQSVSPPGTEIGMFGNRFFSPTPPLQTDHLVDPFLAGQQLHRFGAAALGIQNEDALIVLRGGSGTGRDLYEVRPADDDAWSGSTRTVAYGAPAEAPQIIPAIGREPILPSLVLILAGLGVRAWFAVQGGAHLPFLAVLYAKIHKDKALEHRHRDAIMRLVSSDPGIVLTDIASRLGVSRTAAYHHLETLVRNGLIKRTLLGRKRHYFPAEMADPRDRLRGAVERNSDWSRLLHLVETEPGVAVGSLAQQLGASKFHASRTSTRLVGLGLLRKERDGRLTRLYPAEPASTAGPMQHSQRF